MQKLGPALKIAKEVIAPTYFGGLDRYLTPSPLKSCVFRAWGNLVKSQGVISSSLLEV